MSKNKISLGFRTKEEEIENSNDEWDIYPTHVEIPDGYWTISSTANED